jgi:hypothetical protein
MNFENNKSCFGDQIGQRDAQISIEGEGLSYLYVFVLPG